MSANFIDSGSLNNADNFESPFTELFSLLKRYENSTNGYLSLAYNSDELKVIHQHIENAIDTILMGLRDIGQIISLISDDDLSVVKQLRNIGFFINTISNLTEALNDLRLDADQELRHRGELVY